MKDGLSVSNFTIVLTSLVLHFLFAESRLKKTHIPSS